MNHVERSPSERRAASPVIVRMPFEPTIVTERTRPDGAAFVRTSSSVPRAWSRRSSSLALYRSGPQLWYGESVSYGSGTETRYGRPFEPQTSWTLAVRPPEVEKKNVCARLPS